MEEKFNILSELEESGAVALLNTTNKNYYSVPENYFDNLASDILSNIFLGALPVAIPFSVPQSYFGELPDLILDKIRVREYLSLSTDERHLYTVPEGYFDGLANSILAKIKSSSDTSDPIQEELEEISPLLGKIPRVNVYSVPDNYFEGSFTSITNSKPEAKIISLGGGRRKWFSYAAAACITAFLFGSGYFYLQGHKDYSVSSLPNADVQREISLLSDDDISNYLEENNNMGIYINTGEEDGYQPSSLNIQTMLQNISDEEIQQYLNENPERVKEEGVGI